MGFASAKPIEKTKGRRVGDMGQWGLEDRGIDRTVGKKGQGEGRIDNKTK